ncbi:MAG: DUF4157 domain-containing protein [Stigonema ocellatum SAG 48.90 = DSM 106950]|nr:DUF4157 domain-containing protein [Stigonema ocellatum SAG 48.90 = DSM 106950]
MSDFTFGRKKTATSTFSNPSLVSPHIPTLANPVRGFGLPTNNVIEIATKESTNQQEVQSAGEQSLEQQLIKQRPRGHDISRISFRRPQTKLTMGEPGDKHEQEADRVANQVMRMIVPDKFNAPSVHPVEDTLQRKCIACEEEEDKVQTKPSIQPTADGGLQAGDNIESRLNSSKGGGSALPDEVRSFMEPRFGADFREVRVHTGSEAVQMNRELSAQAFTHKQDIYFGAGKAPGKDALTAHELTHVVQQNGGQVQPMLQCKEENNAALAEIQGLPMYELLPKLQALPFEVRTDEDAGGSVGGPRLVIAIRAVKTKFDKVLVDFLDINKKGLESLPPDQFADILRYLGASDNSLQDNKDNSNQPTSTTSIPVAQLSTTEKFSKAISRAIESDKFSDEAKNRLRELLTGENLAIMAAFTGVYIASQVTPAGWVADGIGIALIIASAVMIGPEVVTIIKHLKGFVQKASNAKNDEDLDAAGEDLAIAVTKIGVDVAIAILLHKAGKAGTKAVKTYVKPSPALVDVLTPDGKIIRIPLEQISKNISESRGTAGEGTKVSLADAIRSLGDDFLDQSEGRGDGHTIREHVARTNQELVKRANQENVDATTFDNKSSTIAAVRYNLRTNAADVAAWLEDTNAPNRKTCDAQHPMRIGRGVKAGRKTVNYDISVSRIVLVKDPTMPLKFRILTGFPLLDP